MHRLPSIAGMTLTAALMAAPALGPVLAQTPAEPAQGKPDRTTTTGKMLQVATVKLSDGWRASKLIGGSVYNEQDQSVGSIDDLVLTHDDKIAAAILSVGGFLGIGSKLVAIPWDQFRFGKDDRVELPGASHEALNAMPSFTYGG